MKTSCFVQAQKNLYISNINQRCNYLNKKITPINININTRSSSSSNHNRYENDKLKFVNLLKANATSSDPASISKTIETNESMSTNEFNIPLAVDLAGCSFQAYNDPDDNTGLKQISSNSTYTSYLNKDYLMSSYDGILEITLKSASKLPQRDLIGKCDPYAILSVGDNMVTSKVIPQDLNPEWNETFHLYVSDWHSDILKIRLFDEDTFKSDDSCGITMYPLNKISIKKRHISLQLNENEEDSKIHLSAKFLPFKNDKMVKKKNVKKSIEGPLEKVEEKVSRVLSKVDKETILYPDAWSALSKMVGRQIDLQFEPICFIENTETDTQLWVYESKKLKEVVIAFRGTEQVKIKDLATDANIQFSSFDIERTGPKFFSKFFSSQSNSSESIKVHKGFLDAYDSVKGRLFTIIDNLTNGNPEWTICLTGHSLGGSLATLCAYELITMKYSNLKNDDRPKIKLYTYGSPRVGNKAFAISFNENITDSWRIINKKDIVPTLPALAGYHHVDRVVCLHSDGSLELDKNEIVDVLRQTHLRKVIKQLEISQEEEEELSSFDAIGRKILGYELEFFSLLVDGSGLAEHMEDYYYKRLSHCTSNTNSTNSSLNKS